MTIWNAAANYMMVYVFVDDDVHSSFHTEKLFEFNFFNVFCVLNR